MDSVKPLLLFVTGLLLPRVSCESLRGAEANQGHMLNMVEYISGEESERIMMKYNKGHEVELHDRDLQTSPYTCVCVIQCENNICERFAECSRPFDNSPCATVNNINTNPTAGQTIEATSETQFLAVTSPTVPGACNAGTVPPASQASLVSIQGTTYFFTPYVAQGTGTYRVQLFSTTPLDTVTALFLENVETNEIMSLSLVGNRFLKFYDDLPQDFVSALALCPFNFRLGVRIGSETFLGLLQDILGNTGGGVIPVAAGSAGAATPSQGSEELLDLAVPSPTTSPSSSPSSTPSAAPISLCYAIGEAPEGDMVVSADLMGGDLSLSYRFLFQPNFGFCVLLTNESIHSVDVSSLVLKSAAFPDLPLEILQWDCVYGEGSDFVSSLAFCPEDFTLELTLGNNEVLSGTLFGG